MRRTVIALSFMLALAFVVVPTSVSASADRTVTHTLKCQKFSCEGDWTWYQGGTSGTQLGSGRINGDYGSTTTSTTVQPAAADTVSIHGSIALCSASQVDSFTPGSGVNFTLTINSSGKGFGQDCHMSFNMKS
jgi:hypothetical protein